MNTIAMISQFPPFGQSDGGRGLAGYTAGLTEGLLAQGKRLVVIANKIPEQAPVVGKGNLRVHRVWENQGAVKAVLDACLSSDADIFHLQHELFAFGKGAGVFTASRILRGLRQKGKRTVTTVHGIVPWAQADSQFVKAYSGRMPRAVAHYLHDIVLRQVMRASDRVLVHHEYQRRLLELMGDGVPISVIPHGLRLGLVKPSRKQGLERFGLPDARRLVFFGYHSPYKGLDTLLSAVPMLRNEGIDVLIAGGLSGDSAPTYRTSPGEEHRGVTTLGYVQDADIPSLFAIADALVLPHLLPLAASGPFHLSAAYGVPVLLSNIPTFRELISTPEVFFEPGDSRGLVMAARELLERASLRERILRELESIRLKCSWSVVADMTSKVYDAIA